MKGGIVTENVKQAAANEIQKYYKDKGYLDVRTAVEEQGDSSRANSVILVFNTEPGDRVKIKDIQIVGNENLKEKSC